ncbi:hypothetical protein ACQX3I_10940, partial [Corynebacterium diphtheriae]
MGLRSLEYENTTKSNTRQGVFLVLVWLLVCSRVSGNLQHETMTTNPCSRIRDDENPTTTTPTPKARPWVYVITNT